MLTGIQGLTGHGKTMFMAWLLKRQWKNEVMIYPNFDIWFDDEKRGNGIDRWHVLDDTFGLDSGVIAIDEGAKILDARKFMSMPKEFADKVAEHRHYNLQIIFAVQDFNDIDVRIRRNTHELYTCHSVFRIPFDEDKKPIFQIIRVNKKTKVPSDSFTKMRWKSWGNAKTMFISKYWTKTYYNTYSKNIGGTEFLCKIKAEKTTQKGKIKWKGKLYQASLVHKGKARL